MGTYTQQKRLLSVTTPLGADVLLLTAFVGREEVSRLFSYQLDLLSENAAVAAKDIVGQGVTWTVRHVDSEPRHFHGVVCRFAVGPTKFRNLRHYRAEVVPWLWFLTRTANCRIFQNKTAPDIIKQVFDDLGFSDYQFKLQGSYGPREYCVQYRETAFNFVSRLMEEEGIFYFFKHQEGKHTLVLGDAKTAHQDVPETPVAYALGSKAQNHVSAWEHRYEFRTGKWAQTDYNFETPSTSLLTTTNTLIDQPKATKFEVFDYPGLYLKKPEGDAETKVRMEEEETGYDLVHGASRCVTFIPGGKFTLEGHDAEAENQAYVFTAVEHTATDNSYSGTDAGSEYGNTFECIPAAVPFRPARLTRKPFVQGVQTAVVVGPKGEEIYVDKYGRVKVQFHWDRVGKKDENSSCWIRVAEVWAGKNWGMVYHPRIGQEVVVDFLEGDPDRPLITGRVYNAEQMPPYTLPANMTQSGVKSRSSKQGTAENFNELRFEDKKDAEDIYFHAEKDFHRVVENNDDLKVGFEKKDKGDQTIAVFNNRTLTVGCSNATDGSETTTIWKNRTETVKEGNETVTVEKGNRTVTVSKGDDKHEVTQGKRDVIVNGNDTHQVKTGNRSVKVDTGNDAHQVAKGNRDVTIDMGNDALTIKMGNQTTKLNLGKSATEAMQSIELKVGQSSIKLDQTGVTIKGMMVKVEGQVQTQVKGLMTMIDGTAMLKAKGGVTMIG
jgi:type VI secretion system secreted protein VgrG